MSDYDLWGPWCSTVQHNPPRPNPEPSKFWRVFAFACVMAAVAGVLIAASQFQGVIQ